MKHCDDPRKYRDSKIYTKLGLEKKKKKRGAGEER